MNNGTFLSTFTALRAYGHTKAPVPARLCALQWCAQHSHAYQSINDQRPKKKADGDLDAFLSESSHIDTPQVFLECADLPPDIKGDLLEALAPYVFKR